LSFILGAIGTAPENMQRYLETKNLNKQLEEFYKAGEFINLSTNQVNANGKIIFTVPQKGGVNLSGGLLKIRYQCAQNTNQVVIRFDRQKDSEAGKPSLANEILPRFVNTNGKEAEIQIPLPSVPGLSEIKNIVIIYNEAGEKFPKKFRITGFEFVQYN